MDLGIPGRSNGIHDVRARECGVGTREEQNCGINEKDACFDLVFEISLFAFPPPSLFCFSHPPGLLLQVFRYLLHPSTSIRKILDTEVATERTKSMILDVAVVTDIGVAADTEIDVPIVIESP